jgi:hypothetical protein
MIRYSRSGGQFKNLLGPPLEFTRRLPKLLKHKSRRPRRAHRTERLL